MLDKCASDSQRLEIEISTKMESLEEGQVDNVDGFLLQNFHRNQHPLMNSLVLELFFDLCDPEDLPRLRLVSKLWHSESLARFRQETTSVEIGRPEGLTSCKWKELNCEIAAGKRPFRSFRLRDFVNFNFVPIQPNSLNSREESALQVEEFVRNVDWFWTNYGPQIHRLELVSCSCSSTTSFRKLVFEGTPNLKELHLNSFRETGTLLQEHLDDISDRHLHLQLLRITLPFGFQLKWHHLLRLFPNLQTLEIGNLEFSNDVKRRNFWLELLRICQEYQGNHLTRFQTVFKNVSFKLRLPILNERLPRSDAINIYEMHVIGGINMICGILQPKLVNAVLDLEIQNCEDEEVHLLRELIRLGGDTMKEIILKVDRVLTFGSALQPIRDFTIELGPFPSVTKLHLTGCACENLHFLDKFPNVKDVRLELPRSSNEMPTMGNTSLDRLTSFVYYGHFRRPVMSNSITYFTSPRGLCRSVTTLHLSKCTFKNLHFLDKFPNLEELQLKANRSDEMLQRTDLTRMGNVRFLKLKTFQYFADCPQVPIPEDILQLFMTMMPELECFEAPLTNSLFRVVCRDWTRLRELHTDCDNMRDEDKIDDAGVTGIVVGKEDRLPNITDMKNLEVLSIRNIGKAADFSVREGFLQMPQLKILNVDLDETSYESFLALIKRFPKGRISRCHPDVDAKRSEKNLLCL